jgi:hypothetical protein
MLFVCVSLARQSRPGSDFIPPHHSTPFHQQRREKLPVIQEKRIAPTSPLLLASRSGPPLHATVRAQPRNNLVMARGWQRQGVPFFPIIHGQKKKRMRNFRDGRLAPPAAHQWLGHHQGSAVVPLLTPGPKADPVGAPPPTHVVWG